MATSSGSNGNDTLLGTPDADSLAGLDGDDSLVGLAGNDTLLGGAGADRLLPGLGLDVIDGGADDPTPDTLSYAELALAVQVDLRSLAADGSGIGSVVKGFDGSGGFDRIQHVDSFELTALADLFRGSAAGHVEQVFPGAGNDTLDGGPIDELLLPRNANRLRFDAAPAAVTVDLAAGSASGGWGDKLFVRFNEVVGSRFADTLIGSNDAVRLEAFEGGAGNDHIDGAGGIDLVRYGTAGVRVVVDLGAGLATDDRGGADTLVGIEWVDGSVFADTITGHAGANRLSGNAGADLLAGAAGDDTLDGGPGDDTLRPGPGIDTVTGGDGDDIVALLGARADYTVTRIGPALAQLSSASSSEDVRIDEVERVAFADTTVTFAQLFDTTAGGQDQLFAGSAQADRFDGASGNDTLLGEGGDDVLIGGSGSDSLDGGEGRDIAAFPGTLAVNVNLDTGVATQGADSDQLLRIEAVFGSAAGDSLRGRDGESHLRGDTLRGTGGNDIIDGGAGVDTAEWQGPRFSYTVTHIDATTWTVRDNDSTDGDDGTDTVRNIERFVFADQLLAFGSRAEEIARVAMVLWSPAILSSSTLFARAYSYYDVGYDFVEMSRTALNFWTQLSDAELATQLATHSGTTKTAAMLLATLQAAGGGVPGRAAAVREAALDEATTARLAASGVRDSGVVSDNLVPGFGVLFELINGG